MKTIFMKNSIFTHLNVQVCELLQVLTKVTIKSYFEKLEFLEF